MSSMFVNKIAKMQGKRFKSERLRLALRQKDIAKTLGVTYQQIQKYESGSNRVSAVSLYLLRYNFGFSANYIIFGSRDE